MDEASTRLIIDQMLRDAGWQADTVHLRHSKGTRPQRGVNQAIAKWPMPGMQSADYVLFCSLTPMAVVEAKRMNQNVAGKIGQAERYARAFAAQTAPEGVQPHAQPWQDGQGQHFHIPFAYSCNGRPYVKQHEASSGTWFRDLRHPSHIAKALQGFNSPQGLQDLLQRDVN